MDWKPTKGSRSPCHQSNPDPYTSTWPAALCEVARGSINSELYYLHCGIICWIMAFNTKLEVRSKIGQFVDLRLWSHIPSPWQYFAFRFLLHNYWLHEDSCIALTGIMFIYLPIYFIFRLLTPWSWAFLARLSVKSKSKSKAIPVTYLGGL
jgi:hypothetical protein